MMSNGACQLANCVTTHAVTIGLTIEPTVTNEAESDALAVPLHSPAFLFERVTRGEDGSVVEYVRSIYRGDRYRLVTELNGPQAAAPGIPVLTPVRDGRGGIW